MNGLNREFTVEIDGTTITGSMPATTIQLHIEGRDVNERGTLLYHLLYKFLVNEEGHDVKAWNIDGGHNIAFLLRRFDHAEDISPANGFHEVETLLRQLQKTAQRRNPTTRIPQGFERAVEEISEHIPERPIERVPDPADMAATRVNISGTALRKAVGLGLVDSYTDHHIPDTQKETDPAKKNPYATAAKLKIVSDTIMETLAKKQTEKTRSAGKHLPKLPLTEYETRLAIRAGLEAGLKKVGVTDINAVEGDVLQEIYKQLREAKAKSPPRPH